MGRRAAARRKRCGALLAALLSSLGGARRRSRRDRGRCERAELAHGRRAHDRGPGGLVGDRRLREPVACRAWADRARRRRLDRDGSGRASWYRPLRRHRFPVDRDAHLGARHPRHRLRGTHPQHACGRAAGGGTRARTADRDRRGARSHRARAARRDRAFGQRDDGAGGRRGGDAGPRRARAGNGTGAGSAGDGSADPARDEAARRHASRARRRARPRPSTRNRRRRRSARPSARGGFAGRALGRRRAAPAAALHRPVGVPDRPGGADERTQHAGRAHVQVRLRYRAKALEIEVADDGVGNSANSGGHGLAGMGERVAVFGGEFAAGPRPEGGFLVRALLPLESPA